MKNPSTWVCSHQTTGPHPHLCNSLESAGWRTHVFRCWVLTLFLGKYIDLFLWHLELIVYYHFENQNMFPLLCGLVLVYISIRLTIIISWISGFLISFCAVAGEIALPVAPVASRATRQAVENRAGLSWANKHHVWSWFYPLVNIHKTMEITILMGQLSINGHFQ